jgi:hypothetical protein
MQMMNKQTLNVGVAVLLGALLGGGVLAVAQTQGTAAPRTGLVGGPVTELFFSGNKEGLQVNNSPASLAAEDTKLIDLPVFVQPGSTAQSGAPQPGGFPDPQPGGFQGFGPPQGESNGRYQALSLGDGRDFMVLDTRTGLINASYESGKVQVFNSLVPNHVIEAPIKRHTLGEELR